jgi:iron complex transport system substrate-binding protein
MKKMIMLWLVCFSAPAHANDTPERIISVGGALTEIIYQLGEEDRLVGNDTTSYYPPEAKKLPKVGYQRALSAEGILSLKPDLVILTTEAGPPAVLEQLKTAGVKLLVLEADFTIEGVTSKIEKIANRLDVSAQGQSLISSINYQLSQLEKKIAAQDNKPKVMFILQHGGGAPMVAGSNTAADGIIELSGAENIVSEYEGYKPLTPEALVSNAPDIILVTDRGLEQAGGKKEMLKTPGLALTPAAKNNHIIAMDSLLLLGFGPRTTEAATALFEAYGKL